MKAQLKTITFIIALATTTVQPTALAQQQPTSQKMPQAERQPSTVSRPQSTPALPPSSPAEASSPKARTQTPNEPRDVQQKEQQLEQQRERRVETPEPTAASPSSVEKQEGTAAIPVGGTRSSDVSAEGLIQRREDKSEEEASILLHYNNFMSSYRLGPEDIVSITVFGHERYSKANIVVPPTGIIAYPLISDGIRVGGKTTEQIQVELTKRLDEYIIDPKVSVSLDQARSARYSVLGDVVQPGIKPMTRRLSVYEAITESGGVLRTGDKKKVVLLRRQPDGLLQPKIINIAMIEKGKAPDMDYLAPGDQVFVPGNRFKTVNAILQYLPIISFARIFTGGY
ncbi:MAG: polysaccharide biosynthesis/export family protein [Pyrinomonadaceae bacterium]|nr:polysaccharide biosynthesis/export family protein [Pyrinomonadaceae bacterium]